MNLAMRFCSLLCAAILIGCGEEGNNNGQPNGSSSFELIEAFPNLSFNRPVDLQNAGDGTNRVFVAEQRGVISVFPNQANVSEAGIFFGYPR